MSVTERLGNTSPLTHEQLDDNFKFRYRWRSSVDYRVNMVIIHEYNEYECIVNHTSSTTFDLTKWKKLNDQSSSSQDNKWRIIDFGIVSNTGNGLIQVASKINSLPEFIINEDEILLLSGTVNSSRSNPARQIKYVTKSKGKGIYGSSLNPNKITLTDSDLYAVFIEKANPIALTTLVNSVVINLNEIANGDFLTKINTSPTPYNFTDTSKIYFIQFTKGGKDVLYGFDGPNSQYGSTASQMNNTHVFLINDDSIDESGVLTLSGDGVNNTDPKNPTISLTNYQLKSEKNSVNGYAGLDSSGKILQSQIPNIAITDIITASENTLTLFTSNNTKYTYQKGDVIIITDSSQITQHYLYNGGPKTTETSYSLIESSKISWENVINKPTRIQNTVWYGTGATLNTKTLVAEKLFNLDDSPFASTDIHDLEIINGNTVFNVFKQYKLKTFFANNTNITFYEDVDGWCRILDGFAFANCTNLLNFYLPKADCIGIRTFSGSGLTGKVEMPELKTNTSLTFENCSGITSAYLPKATILAGRMFKGSSITEIKEYDYFNVIELDDPFPKAPYPLLTTINFPNVRIIKTRTFENFRSLTTLSLPKLEIIDGVRAMRQTLLHTIDLPNLKTITNNSSTTALWTFETFNNTTKLINIPNCTQLGNEAILNGIFFNCASDIVVNVHKSYKFKNNLDLNYVISRGGTVNYVGDGFVNDLGIKGITFQDNAGATLGETNDVIKLNNLTWDNATKTLTPVISTNNSTHVLYSNTTLETNTYGCFISDSGMWITWSVRNATNNIYSGYLTTPFDLTTIDVNTVKTFNSGDANDGVTISSDGTQMYLLSNSTGVPRIKQYTLSTSFDISSATLLSNTSMSFATSLVSDMYINNSGTKMWVANVLSERVEEFNLTTPYTISTLTFVKSYPLSEIFNRLEGISFANNGYEFYAGSRNTNASAGGIIYYHLTVPYNLDTKKFVSKITTSVTNSSFGIHASNNYKYVMSVFNGFGQIIKNNI